jgi:hypothetical protein
MLAATNADIYINIMLRLNKSARDRYVRIDMLSTIISKDSILSSRVEISSCELSHLLWWLGVYGSHVCTTRLWNAYS